MASVNDFRGESLKKPQGLTPKRFLWFLPFLILYLKSFKFPESTISLLCPRAPCHTKLEGQGGDYFPKHRCCKCFILFLGRLFLTFLVSLVWFLASVFVLYFPYIDAAPSLKAKADFSHLMTVSFFNDQHLTTNELYGFGPSVFDLCHIFETFFIILLLNCAS